jgi:DNA adenine methylase
MSEKVFTSPIKIQGIKTKLVPLIKQSVIMDKDSVWIEPFMGSGVVGFNVEPHKAVFADTNPHIIEFFNQIKRGVITPYAVRVFLEHEGKLLERGDDEYYYAVRARFNKYHNPLDFLFLNRACFNGMIRFNKNYEFNVPYGHKPKRFAKAYITKIVNQVTHISNLLQNNSWDFICQPFVETISMARNNDFIYCDPPYIGRHVDYYDSCNEESEITKRINSFVISKLAQSLLTASCNDGLSTK